jgi:hypothetical protein
VTDHGDHDDREAARQTAAEQDDPATQPDPGDADAPEEGTVDDADD